MDNWITGFLEYVKNTESPKIFSEWTAYSTLAAAMERRVYITRGHITIYPDLYVILVAKSGMRKSSAAKIAIGDIMGPLDQFNIINTIKMTAESLYLELSDKNLIDHCAYIFADELQTFLGNQGFKGDAVGALTILYDSPDKGQWRSVVGGTRIVSNANVNLLACTTFNYIGIMLPKEAIECGFAPRVMWITATKPGKKFPWGAPEVDYSLRDKLRTDLLRIKGLVGRVTVSRDAHHFYDSWYNNYSPKCDQIMEPYFLRKGTTVLKIAMILAVSSVEVTDIERMIIEEKHISKSLKILDKAEQTMASIYNASMGDISKNCERILDYMVKKGGLDIPHSQITNALYRYIKTIAEFREAVDFLLERRSIVRGILESGGRCYSIKNKKYNADRYKP